MKVFTETFTAKLDDKGKALVSESGNELVVTSSGNNIWVAKDAIKGKFVTYKVHEKGETFTAAKDSKRTKGEVLGADCPEGLENQPLYLKGEQVIRKTGSVEFVGFCNEMPEVDKETVLTNRIKLMKDFGLTATELATLAGTL